jgi:hypothetical protein
MVKFRAWLLCVIVAAEGYSTANLTPTGGVWPEGDGKNGLRIPGKYSDRICINGRD